VRVLVLLTLIAIIAAGIQYWRTRQVREAVRIGMANPGVITRGPIAIDSPNRPDSPDCQASHGGSEPRRIAQWLRRVARVAGGIGYRLLGRPFS
jgi:hypothetical protein